MNFKSILPLIISILLCKAVIAQTWYPIGGPGFSGEVRNFSMAISKNGTPYIAYADDNNASKATVMKYNGTSWVSVGIAGFSGGSVEFISIAVDNAGTPYVVFSDWVRSKRMTVMKFVDGSWVNVGIPGISPGQAVYTQLAIDRNDTPYVAYQDWTTMFNIRVMKYDGSTWNYVGNTPANESWVGAIGAMRIDKEGIPYIVSEDHSVGLNIIVKKYNGSEWNRVGHLIGGYIGTDCIELDSNGIPYVVYMDQYTSNVTVAKYNGSIWELIDGYGLSVGAVGTGTIAIDKNNTLYVAFKDSAKATTMKYDVGGWSQMGNARYSDGAANCVIIKLDDCIKPYVGYVDDSNGKKATVMTLTVPPCTGQIEDAKAIDSISVFPNHSSGQFTIQAKGLKHRCEATIYTAMGREVYHAKIVDASTDVDLSNHPSGVYYLYFSSESNMAVQKIMIQH